MREPRIYLDSSIVVKRYVEEPGSNTVKQVYRRAYAGEVKLVFSLWNVGEVLGAFDRARSRVD
jgi:predicted nucleic acid-binding protein